MRVVVAPGQGSQSQGFLKPWLEQVSGFKEKITEYSEIVDLDLIQFGTLSDEETIRDTSIAQPLIVAAALASYRTLFGGVSVDATAGHSVGEFAAAAIAGVLSDAEALGLVAIRARAMAAAAKLSPTSMAAVIGGELEDVIKSANALGLTPANFNGAGQLVVAGPKSAIAAFVQGPPEKTRVVELKVAGAFHTAFMESAKQELSAAASKISPKDPAIPIYSNQAGQLIRSGDEFLSLLVAQVSAPVRWDMVMKQFEGKAAEVIELLPAGALSGLFKRAVQDCRTVALKTPEDFEKVER